MWLSVSSIRMLISITLVIFLVGCNAVKAQPEEANLKAGNSSSASSSISSTTDLKTDSNSKGMNNKRLQRLITRIDRNAKGRPGYWQFSVENRTVVVITDESADRMRILSSVVKTDELENTVMKRLLQANFDSALDARYAIAKGILWSTFIHPLSPLQDKQFLEGVGQVVNLAATFGGSYSSGALVFNGGDSRAIQRRNLINKLIEKGMAI